MMTMTTMMRALSTPSQQQQQQKNNTNRVSVGVDDRRRRQHPLPSARRRRRRRRERTPTALMMNTFGAAFPREEEEDANVTLAFRTLTLEGRLRRHKAPQNCAWKKSQIDHHRWDRKAPPPPRGGGGGRRRRQRRRRTTTTTTTTSTPTPTTGGSAKKTSLGSSPNNASACLRLQSDLRSIRVEPPEGCSASPHSDDNLFVWSATICGPQDSPWEGGIFSLRLTFSDAYPATAPRVRFVSEMFHPNIYPDGTLCMDTIQDQWSPVHSVASLLTSVRSLLCDPNVNSPANPQAAKMFVEEEKEYNKRVRRLARKTVE
mmetsp:Transcript_3567/g.10944  ORF Transcript_3567/g.10944 Transcript_3567/m.10944 type:complete len:316 (+) Transcript_3567:93-1040(+)